MLTSQDSTSPHLSRLVWLGEQLQSNAAELTELFRVNEGVRSDLNGAEFDALRAAAAAARTAGGDVVLIATAAHRRGQAPARAGRMSAGPVPVFYAGVYHRPSDEFCLVTAIHRVAGEVTGYDLRNDYARTELRQVPAAEVDLWRTETRGITTIWRHLQPGMTMMWIDGIQVLAGESEPQQLDVLAIRRPAADDGLWLVDAVQGRYAIDPTFTFDEVTPELADLISCLITDEQHRGQAPG